VLEERKNVQKNIKSLFTALSESVLFMMCVFFFTKKRKKKETKFYILLIGSNKPISPYDCAISRGLKEVLLIISISMFCVCVIYKT
jgi:hypothetical protein